MGVFTSFALFANTSFEVGTKRQLVVDFASFGGLDLSYLFKQTLQELVMLVFLLLGLLLFPVLVFDCFGSALKCG